MFQNAHIEGIDNTPQRQLIKENKFNAKNGLAVDEGTTRSSFDDFHFLAPSCSQ